MSRALLVVLILISSVSYADGDDSQLVKAIDAYLTKGATAGENFHTLESGKLFVEYVIADVPSRRAGIRRLHEAYAGSIDLKETLVPYVLLHRLPIGLDELALAVSDKIFDPDPKSASKWARVFSDRLGSESLSGYVDIGRLDQAVAAYPKNPEALAIVRFLYQKSPSSALLLLARSQTRGLEERELLLNDRQITSYLLKVKLDPKAENGADKIRAIVQELGKDRRSWVRLYAVEMMIQNPILKDDEVLKVLETDADELVALAVKAVADPKGQIRHTAVRTPWQAYRTQK